MITQTREKRELVPDRHKEFQGIGAGFVPRRTSICRSHRARVEEQVADGGGDPRSRWRADWPAKRACCCRIPCGAAMVAALRLAALPELAGKTIVTVLPDAGERYLSGALFEGMFDGVKRSRHEPGRRLRLRRRARASSMRCVAAVVRATAPTRAASS